MRLSSAQCETQQETQLKGRLSSAQWETQQETAQCEAQFSSMGDSTGDSAQWDTQRGAQLNGILSSIPGETQLSEGSSRLSGRRLNGTLKGTLSSAQWQLSSAGDSAHFSGGTRSVQWGSQLDSAEGSVEAQLSGGSAQWRLSSVEAQLNGGSAQWTLSST